MILIDKLLLKKLIIASVCIISVSALLFYYTLDYTATTGPVIFILPHRSELLCLSNNSRSSVPLQITCSQCHLSLEESDGWFCEFDQEWQRRKGLHRIQNQINRVSDEPSYFFQHNWHPTVHCEFARRMGAGDGGKWVCDIHKLQSINSTPPLIYSFGSNGDFTFENAIKQELPESEIHTFDQNVYVCPDNVCVFHQIYVGDGRTNGSRSLQMIFDDLNHRERDIDILKVDIEGSEFTLFDELFKPIQIRQNVTHSITSKALPYIRQILVEIHLRPNVGEVDSRRAHVLFETFRQNNYAIFHKEPNLFDCRRIVEYAFIRLNPAFFTKS